MNLYYEFFMRDDYRNTLLYSFHLNQYIRDIHSLKQRIKTRAIRPCKFGKHTVFKDMYYLPLLSEKTVKNTLDLKRNLILSGPNASGKTTVLKSMMINTLMCQQFGLGCFSDATVCVYDFFHSYLNIPDTSGRDSLFQAEARRCKEILDCVLLHKDKRHLCIFDEIYSGTNPIDAVSCAKMYLSLLNELKPSIDYLITTHFIDLCKHFVGSDHAANVKMDVLQTEEKITFFYRILEGYSMVHGGKYILKEMNYPDILFR
jgi:DNA mismatch repair ATPase MutS